ncbi:SDR family oxidoreductase [Enterococcus sp. 669A]|uniref:SDR family oxidoreductase n=1 Tax=Candidatus Enterococcus moelleringii TaxID=2815325 RepID=A0ABS3LB46_9ENTE|nr:SDR family oxidoreductase [Enterococcus sp. 669A]MBO1306285.1 SDR family oxidoreductase [Enterococcus sp. 669A]
MKDWINLEKAVVIVTGGSSGIGESLTIGLSELGAAVINVDIKPCENQHPNVHFIETDVSNKSSIEQMVTEVVAKFGRIDSLINNAGINLPALLVDAKQPTSQYELSEEIVDKLYAINQKSVFLVSQAVTRVMLRQEKGVIINMSSESGLEGSEGQSFYAATKAAINSFTRSWAKELGKKGIRVVGIAPGIMEATGLRTQSYEEALSYTRGITVEQLRANYSNVGQIPLGRSGKLKEVADLACFLLSDRASYLTGVTINISGGKSRG